MISAHEKNALRTALFAAAAPLFAALAPLSAASARGGAADDLMRRHLNALGGEAAVKAVATVLARGEIEITGTGLRGSIESRSARPCLSSSDISLGFISIREGFDGERIWLVDPNGGLQIRRDEGSLAYQRTICALESQRYIFGGEGLSIEPAGRDTAGGDSCDAVALAVAGGAPCRLLFDGSTHLLRRMEIRAPEGFTVHTYGDYRRVQGVMYPFLQRTELPALGQRVEIRYAEIVPNARIDPATFVPPASAERSHRFASGRGVADAPFEYRYRHIFVPVRIEGRDEDLLFLVDSGASMTVIDSTVAADLGLASGGVLPGAGAGGAANFRMIRVPGLRLGDIEISEQTAVAFPVAGLLRQFEETEIGGILGYDFLSRFTIRIEYDRRLLTFFEPDSFAPAGGETAVDAPLMRSIFSVPVTLDGARTGSFLLDTGASSSIVQGAYARETGVSAGRRGLEIALRGAGGEERAELFRFDTLSIGGVAITEPVLAVATGPRGLAAIENVDGLVGNDVLERFTVTLDYRAQRVLLERNGLFSEPFFRDRSGLQLARKPDGRIMIVNVVPESPAARAGFRAGDVITAIGRTKAARFGSLREAIALFEGAEGTTYRIEIERSRGRHTLTLTLERYI
ncbi:MAG: PDZ domain-containing protein [Candidatus Latescibacterota bacterium]|nr:MAG: PDZ domain-containing protein [Candidatus Latescibacterota bacterium]